MQSPEQTEDLPPLTGDVFPITFPFNDLFKNRFAWKKYFFSPGNYIYIPKNYNQCELEILI